LIDWKANSLEKFLENFPENPQNNSDNYGITMGQWEYAHKACAVQATELPI